MINYYNKVKNKNSGSALLILIFILFIVTYYLASSNLNKSMYIIKIQNSLLNQKP